MPAPTLTKADLLQLWRRIFPDTFTVPIEETANGQGLDIYAAQAAQFARVSEAVTTSTQAYYLRPHSTQLAPPAGGPRAASGQVLISRTPPAIGDLVIQEGTAVVARILDPNGDLVDGPRFFLAATTVPAGSLGPIATTATAERVGYQGNVSPHSITAFAERGRATISPATIEDGNVLRDNGAPDRFTAAMVGQFVRLVGGLNGGTFPRRILSFMEGATSIVVVDGPPLLFPDACVVEVEEFADVGLLVDQPAAMTGGRHGWLDAIGRDRNVARQPLEDDESYRDRIVELADVVSPGAILRAAARVLTPLGIPFRLLEARDPLGLRGFILDFDPFDFGDILDGAVLLDADHEVRFFVLAVGIGNQGEFGFPWDGLSYRPAAAWDWGFFDGYPVDYLAALAALWDAINRARAAGVGWVLVRDPSL